MNFQEVLQAVVDEKTIHYVVNVLITLYPDQADSADGYFAVILEMLGTDVEGPERETAIHVDLESFGDEEESAHVYGTTRGYTTLQSYMESGFDEEELRKKSHPDTLESDAKMAIELTPWPEVLGYEFVTTLPVDVALAHALWEMTFFGFSNESIQEKAKEIFAPLEDLKEGNFVTLEELEEEFGEDNDD